MREIEGKIINETIQEYFPGVKDMSFQIEKATSVLIIVGE